MSVYADAFKQCFFIPKPTLTEENLASQAGRVFIVTGGYAGVGKELSKILYSKNGTVYLAGRSKGKADAAISEIQSAHPRSDGRLEFLHLDLADLASIKASVDDFHTRESRLDVLTNNAGVMTPPSGSKAAQGHELQLATNCLGPYLLTTLLTPLLAKTAQSSPAGSVRVTWAGSLATLLGAPTHGIAWDDSAHAPRTHAVQPVNYGQSKAGNVLLAKEYQRRLGAQHGIVSNAWNPGNLWSELQRHSPALMKPMFWALLYPPVFGAYTELYAGWSEEAGREGMQGKYFGPWGREVALRKDLEESPNQGRFWEWCERETKAFA